MRRIKFIRLIGDFIMDHSTVSIILIYNLVTLFVIMAFYPIIPILMGYAPNFKESTIAIGASYNLQFILISLIAIIVGTLIFAFLFRGINGWRKLSKENADDYRKILKIRKKCINFPYLIYIAQLLLSNGPILIMLVILKFITNAPVILELKLFTVIFSLFSLAGVFSHIFSKRIFMRILLRTYKNESLEGIRIKLTTKIFMQILPVIIVAILFTIVLGYSRIIEEKGDMTYLICKSQLNDKLTGYYNFSNPEEIFKKLEVIKLENTKISYFVKQPDGKIVSTDSPITNRTFLYYLEHPYKGDRLFGNSNENQGVIKSIPTKNGKWIAGIEFKLASDTTVNYFLAAFFAILILNIFVLYYFSKTLSGEISLVAEGLTEIAEGESVNLDRKLAVTSNDEIADLIIAFNKIQDREKEHIKEIEDSQAILFEQERLASMGQLIGGIAHNLRSPLMSLSGAIEGLKDLIKEYDDSIDDNEVNRSDHHEIATEMKAWINKMKPYCTYMDDIITAVKGQTTQYEDKTGLGFTLDELGKRVEILVEHEIRGRHCRLKSEFSVDRNIRINGEISVLVQILNNLIVNASDSYMGASGDIEFKVTMVDKFIEFIIRDFGSGISPEVQKKLFKEMITTKGKNGTGLGLYMSYSNLKARFGGSMSFESELGKGTTFYIKIPYMQK